MWAMIVKEFRQLVRDRRTLAMLLFMPLLLLVVFGYAARFDVTEVRTALFGPDAETVASRLPDTLEVVSTDPEGGREEALETLRRGDAVMAITTGGDPQALIDGSQLFAARTALGVAERFPVPLEIEVLYNPDLETPPFMVPALLGLILVFVGVVATSLGVVRERQAGTLEQLAVMPLRPRDVFLGKVAPYLLVAAADMILIVICGLVLFDVPFEGSVAIFALASLLFLFVTLGFGVLISTVSEPGPGDSAGADVCAAADPALGDDLPGRVDGGRRALDRLHPAAHLLHRHRSRRVAAW